MNAVKLLAIIVVITAVTLLCIRSGQAMAKASYDLTSNEIKPVMAGHDLGKILSVTTPAVILTTNNQTISTTTSAQAINATGELRANPIPMLAQVVSEELVLKNHSSNEFSQATSRSLNNHDDRFAIGPTMSKNRNRSIIAVRGKRIKPNPYLQSHHRHDSSLTDNYSDGDDDDINKTQIIADAVYHENNRLRQMKDYSTIDTDIEVTAEDASTGYHNSYNAGNYKPGENFNEGTGWSTMVRPGGSYGSGYPGGSGSIGQPPYGAAAPYPVSPMMMMGHKQMPRPLSVNYLSPVMNYQPPSSEQYNVYSTLHQIQMMYSKIDWQKIGILALFKIGIAKLKAFGFLKILFLLVFKLKLFLIALFFKFLLILKLMKVFKLMMIPLILLTILPIIASLFSPMIVGGILQIPMQIIKFLTDPVFVPETPGTKTSAFDSTKLPSTSVAKNDILSTPNTKLDKRRLDAFELFDPTLNIFQKLLDSEKCVERIACRIAVVEKAGIFPAWINWGLHRVSKMFSNTKLELYLRTYDNIKYEIYSKSEPPDNWSTWCSERYDCNNINATKAIQ